MLSLLYLHFASSLYFYLCLYLYLYFVPSLSLSLSSSSLPPSSSENLGRSPRLREEGCKFPRRLATRRDNVTWPGLPFSLFTTTRGHCTVYCLIWQLVSFPWRFVPRCHLGNVKSAEAIWILPTSDRDGAVGRVELPCSDNAS